MYKFMYGMYGMYGVYGMYVNACLHCICKYACMSMPPGIACTTCNTQNEYLTFVQLPFRSF